MKFPSFGACLLALGAAATLPAADSYWVDAGVLSSFSSENNNGADVQILGVFGRAHFGPVDIGGGPYREADFIQRVSYVQAVAAQAQLEQGAFEADGFLGNVTVVAWAPMIPVAGSLTFQGLEIEDDTDTVTVSSNNISGRIGYWLRERFLIGATFDVENEEIDDSTTVTDVDTNNYGAFAKWLVTLPTGTTINVEGTASLINKDDGVDDLDNIEVTLLGDFYLTKEYSVGGTITFNAGDDIDEEGQTVTARGTAFFSEQFWVEVELGNYFATDGNVNDEFTVGITAGYRF